MKKSFLKIFAIATAVMMAVVCVLATGCSPKGVPAPEMLKTSDIGYLEEIQATGNLKFEILNSSYKRNRPLAVIFPGESDGSSYSLVLPKSEYFAKTDETPENFTVETGIGYKAEGFKNDITEYWTKIADYNVAIFHWEAFAVEDRAQDIVDKFYSMPKMRYTLGNGVYETTKVPHNNLTEVVAAIYYEQFSELVNGREIRFIGNGVGADLAVSVASYLNSRRSTIDDNVLPTRVALCDPYLSIKDMHMPDDIIPWNGVSTKEGMISVLDKMVSEVAGYGAAIEMIETEEVSVVKEEESSREVVSYAYNIEKSEKAEESYKAIKSNVAHLYLRESYSTKFSDGYRALNRVALDWYLYSVIGSDDSKNSDGPYAVGYPNDIETVLKNTANSSYTWAVHNLTRPMVNNRALNNDQSSSTGSSRGKNFSLSAWTPTSYTRALRGISFTQQKKSSSSTTGTNIHNNSTFGFKTYTMALFRSENFQVSSQAEAATVLGDPSYTLICGYVYLDKNGDGYMNDGLSGLANERLNVKVTTKVNDVETEVSSFFVTTDEGGFYVIRLDDKKKDSEGKLSEEGYCFSTSHTVTIELLPSSHDYYGITSAVSNSEFYLAMEGHNFSTFKGTVTVNYNYADAIQICNCLVKANEE